ncbi:hypothetical protein [Hyphomicrobium sp. MC1]|uniref:hypothetical protein n=1 Tax=Hyphomicrobium sp. (strain MC1) TaxID=717785 RepID=UPI00059DF5CD|nr:hypothetical protein [Hyphomicrobium sp. MC1]
MTLFLDAEFNGFQGELISLGLVSDNSGEFYGVRQLPKKLDPWVKVNVIPCLGQQPESDDALRGRLAVFLQTHRGETVIADWPEDLAKFLGFLSKGNRLVGPATLEVRLVLQQPLYSETPHNALSDAQALNAAWLDGRGVAVGGTVH